MEILYPDGFIRFFNDNEEIDEVGEFEIFTEEEQEFVDRYYDDFNNADYIDDTDEEYIDGYRNNTSRPKYKKSNYSVIPPAIKNIPDNIANFPALMQDLPYAIKDMGHDFMHSAPVSYLSNMLPIPTNWQNPQSPSPLGPPPSYIPSQKDSGVQYSTYSGEGNVKSVSPSSIKFCLYRYTYIWQRNGRSYWAYLTRVDRRSISGWRWAGWRWVYFGVDLRRINSFVCY